ncbi:MAG: ABC-F family ATP-binding cassette domain-containing protein [Firmicutes bacterium]|nr:ABC-F family ATP-binding cassette domain-containing protein [Bacillota bacterium]
MNYISLEGLSKYYGEKTIFENITFGIDEGDKIGVIGVNGTGKSTLLKVIAGVEEQDEGTVTKMRDLEIGYLPQTPFFPEGETVMDYMVRCCHLENEDDVTKAKTVLTRIGIFDYYKDTSSLSGGQKKRVAIAAAMISPVNVLLLDEPTNHIDARTVAWIEENLKKTTKALVMVTHDRYFLDRVANKTIELDKGKMYTYSGNYTEFLSLKAARLALESAEERKRQNFLRTELEWVKRGAKARTTKQKARLSRFESIQAIKAPQKEENIEFTGLSSRLGKKTVILDNISKKYGDEYIIKNFSYTILKNDRIGVIGKNGCGKTTLLNIISGKLQADSGTAEWGETVKIGYFTQDDDLALSNERAIDIIKDVAEYLPTKKGKISASRLLERFLFTSDMQYCPVSKLSGGERRRLSLLKVLMSAPNILLLDEPTNDLDITTLQILEDYLDGFEGAVITVSHDRYFLDRVTDRIFSFEGSGSIRQYEGGYSQALENAETEKQEEPSENKKGQRPVREKKLKMTYKEEKEFETIEDDIASIEQDIEDVEKQMAENPDSYTLLQELSEKREALEKELNFKTERWVYLTELKEATEG